MDTKQNDDKSKKKKMMLKARKMSPAPKTDVYDK
jgi:hypothetical protein